MPIAIGAAERAALRQAALTRQELGRGLRSLAAIPLTAIAAGGLGTVAGILDAFRCCDVAEGTSYERAVAGGIAEAFVPLALGIFIAVPIWLGYRYLRSRAAKLSTEMEIACLGIGAALTPPTQRAPR